MHEVWQFDKAEQEGLKASLTKNFLDSMAAGFQFREAERSTAGKHLPTLSIFDTNCSAAEAASKTAGDFVKCGVLSLI